MVVERAAAGGRLDFSMQRGVAATGAWSSTRATHWQFQNCNTPEELALAAGFLARKAFFLKGAPASDYLYGLSLRKA